MSKCLSCGKETNNPSYCSRSCSAKHTNKIHPKKKCKKTCIVCGDPVKSYRHNRCEVHWQEYKSFKWKDKTLGEYRNALSVRGKCRSWLHSHIRNFARSWLKHLKKLPCARCGYTKHVVLAHIKSVASFPDDTLLSEVNSPDNIIQLCPNCHWEFDNLPRDSEDRCSIL